MARPERFEVEAVCGPFDKFALLICSGQAKTEPRAEILSAAKDRCFAGVSAAGVPGTRGVCVTGAGAPKMSADVEPYSAPPALRDCVANHAHS